MPSVTLTEGWLHLADDLDTYVTFDMAAESGDIEKPDDIRRYVGGRERSITRVGSSRNFTIVMDLPDRDTFDTIQGWIEEGYLLMFRDMFGRKDFGKANRLRWSEIAGGPTDTLQASFEFRRITHLEAV